MEEKNLTTTAGNDIAASQGPVHGFEDSRQEDIIIPRIKVINALSPERMDKIADEGDVINSLTQEKVEDKVFVPLKQYYSNIMWNPDRNAESRMLCRSFDGRIGEATDGAQKSCATCPLKNFDNTKEGEEAIPKCTSYINFLGFFEESPMPVVLSFAKTNYNEGKKLLSMAKSMMSSIYSYGYKLAGKLVTKGNNRWYNIVVTMAGPTNEGTRSLAASLYQMYANQSITTDYEDAAQRNTASDEPNAEIAAEI